MSLREEGAAVFERATSEHPHDAGVIESRQGHAFLTEARRHSGARVGRAQDLDRPALLSVARPAHAQVDGRRPALARHLPQLEATDDLPHQEAPLVARQAGEVQLGGSTIQVRRGLGIGGQHGVDLLPQVRIASALLHDEAHALGVGQGHRALEDGAHSDPVNHHE